MISRQKTFPFDVRDYGRVLQFGMVELKKLLAQLRREQLAPREISVAVRFADFSESRAEHRFRAAQERDEIDLRSVRREVRRVCRAARQNWCANSASHCVACRRARRKSCFFCEVSRALCLFDYFRRDDFGRRFLCFFFHAATDRGQIPIPRFAFASCFVPA